LEYIGERQSVTRGALWLAVASTAVAISVQPANAGFRVCNQFERRVDIAFGYVDRQNGWMAQGWYIMDPSECRIIHHEDLDNRYYYLFIRAPSNGALWTGEVPFCIQQKKFLLTQSQYGKNSPDDCHKAGLDYAQFFKVDVNGAKSFSYTIASNNPGTPGAVPQPQPPPVSAAPAPQPYQQPPQPNQPPVATAPPQPPYQQMPQAPPPQPYQQQPQPYRPPVATAPTQPPYQPAPQAPPPQPYQQQPQPYRPPVATAPPPQPYQPAPQAPMQQPYQPAPQPYQPAPQAPVQQPYQPAPQPQTYQPAPQQAAPPQAGAGTACQRYPNLC
jgi:uncharacterized membrane protein